MNKFTPREYQKLITDHILATPRCAVWAGMGMGKTSATLLAASALLLAEDGPILVVAPLRVARDTWAKESKKWADLQHLNVVPIVGTPAERKRAMHTRADIYTTNYDNLVWLVEEWGDKWPYTCVVADESTKLKGFRLRQGGKRAQALARVAHTKVKRFVQLTGTPSPNGLVDLWGQAWFLDQGQRLGRSFNAFSQRWFRPHHSGFGIVPLPGAQQEIMDRLRDVCITVKPEDWFDLREPRVNNILVDLPVTARNIYKEMEDDMFSQIGQHGVEAFNAAARTMKCLQIANGAAYVDDTGAWTKVHDVKLEALDELVEEQAGSPVLVAYHFKTDRERIMRAFPGAIDVATQEGFKKALKGEGTVWLGHPASMGHGVDGLQEHCHTVCFFGHWWNLEERQQFIERVGPTRQMQAGKDRVVSIHNIVAAGTVDELVLERIGTKREVQDILLDAMRRRKK